MYFQLPTVNTSKNHDVHYKKVHETTAPCIFVKTTKHKIAMPARTVSGPAVFFGSLFIALGLAYFEEEQLENDR